MSSERRLRMIRIAGDSHFSLSLYMLYLSGFFIHCLLENAREIGWSGRWHRGLEGCGVMRRGCGERSAGSRPVPFPRLLSVTQLFNGACEKTAQKENG